MFILDQNIINKLNKIMLQMQYNQLKTVNNLNNLHIITKLIYNSFLILIFMQKY